MSSNGRFSKVQAPIRNVHSNLDQEVIQVTEDKLRLVLNEHLTQVEKKNGWIAPLGIVITIVTLFTTATFKDAFFKAATWEAIFLLSGLLSLAWLMKAAYVAFSSPSVDAVVEKIKNKSVEQSN